MRSTTGTLVESNWRTAIIAGSDATRMLALLQLDATSVPLLEELLAAGRLPALARLRARGTWTALGRSTPLFAEAGGFVTTYSGVEIEEHGIYAAFQWSAGEQRLRFFDEFPPPLAAWERLSRAGGRSLVIDQYESWIPRETAGLHMLNGLQFRHKLTSPFSAPRGADRGPSIEFPYGRPSARTLDRLARTFREAGDRLADATLTALRQERFDLVWLTFAGPHQAGHFLGEADRARLDDVYVSTDRALGRVVDALPDGTDVIVFSPLGMTANRSRTDLLPGMLTRILAGGEHQDGAGSLIWQLRRMAPAELRAALARPLPGPVVRGLTERLFLRGVDWSRTRAFALPGDCNGFIRLNLRGRERDGIVDPADAAALMDEIADGLATFLEPDGSPTVGTVHRIARDGSRAEQLPDLVVEWSDRPSLGATRVTSGRFGTVERRGQGSARPGNHVPDAWALLVPGAARVRETSRPPQITDLAATTCAVLGADTAGLAGESLLEC
jgi:predicted AlkP superfamily phosphohydrolase/phosphomutase